MTARDTVTRILITARDEASSVFTSLQAKVAGVAAAVAGYFGAKLFGDAVSSAREFETAMSRVEAASGATGDELDALRQAAEQAGASTQYTSVEAAAALENLAKAGLSASDAVQTLPAVLDLATAGGVELATASDYITKAVAGMGLSFAEAGRVADVLSQGANASNTSVDGLAQALSYAAPLANSLGLSLEQTVAIIGKFADAGIDASRAGTALNSILAQFSDPASKFRRELADAGIVTGDFDQALRQLAAAGPAGQKAILAVGQEAGPALRSLLNQGIDSLDALKTTLDNSSGSARAFADVMSNNLDAATQGLGSAWEAFKIQLGTPVLDILREQVNALASRLREFVSNGTATAFGEAFRTAFEAAGKWVQDFVGRLDFEQIAARMQAFAARVGEIFTEIGSSARTAGNVVQTAYGVMVAGVNTVMGAIYKIAEAFSGVVSNVLSGVALLNEGLAKITFGNVSESFRQMAEDIRMHAGAMGAVSEEFAQRASASFDAAADGAEIAQRGYAALSEAVTDNARAIDIANKSVTATAQQATLTAAALDALGEGYEYVDGEARKAATAIDATAQAGSDSVPALDSAASSAEAVAAAYERLGVTSTAALQQAADNARRDFEMIRNSGTASAQDIERAFAAYAAKAVAANNGVVSAALQAQAASQGLSVRADESGSVIVASMRAAADATSAVASAAAQGSGEFRNLAGAAHEAAAAIGGIKKPDFEGVGGHWDKDGNMIKGTGGGGTYKRMDNGQAEMLARAREIGGLELEKRIKDSWAAQLHKRRFSGEWGWYLDMLRDTRDELDRMALAKERAERKAAQGEPPAPTNRKWTGQPARDSDDTPARPRSSGRSGGISPDTPRAARSSGISQSGAARTINMNISLNNKQYAMQNMPEQSAQTLETMLRDLERAAGVAQ